MKCIGEDELVRAEVGELTLNRQHEVDAHLAGCSRCRQVRREIRGMMADLGRLPTLPDDSQFVDQVMASRSTRPAPGPRRFGLPVFAAVAVMVLAVGVISLSTSLRRRNEEWTARGQANPRSRTPSAEVLVVRERIVAGFGTNPVDHRRACRAYREPHARVTLPGGLCSKCGRGGPLDFSQ